MNLIANQSVVYDIKINGESAVGTVTPPVPNLKVRAGGSAIWTGVSVFTIISAVSANFTLTAPVVIAIAPTATKTKGISGFVLRETDFGKGTGLTTHNTTGATATLIITLTLKIAGQAKVGAN